MNADTVIIRNKLRQDYSTTWRAMQEFTNTRDENTLDEIWYLEHDPVFTQGQNGKSEHLLNPGTIPVIKVDRGGQVTYHGPGQLMVYILVDLRRKKLNIRQLVNCLENAVIDLLAEFSIKAVAKADAPGVYIDNKKICSVGLRIRRGCSYHGLAFNLNMNLEPFSRINPCGFPDLKITQLADFLEPAALEGMNIKLINYLTHNLGYNNRLQPE